MSGEVNIDGFKLSGDGISLSDFTAKVNNDEELINIYKAFDKNGDNKLSRDELASLLGAYKMLDINGDGTLSKKERKTFDAQITEGLTNDLNSANDGLKIKGRKLNDFFANLMTFIDPNSSGSGDIYTFNNNGQITGGKDSTGEFTRVYNENGYTDTYGDNDIRKYDNNGTVVGGKDSTGEFTRVYNENGYTDTYGDNDIRKYNNSGTVVGGKDSIGEFTRVYNENGYTDTYGDNDIRKYNNSGTVVGGKDSAGEFTRVYTDDGYTDTYSDRILNYNANGKCIGGIDTDGDTWTRTYDSDGSYTDKYEAIGGNENKQEEYYFDADGKKTGGKISLNRPLDTECTVKFDEQGNATYEKYTRSDDTKYFYYYQDNAGRKLASTAVDAKGNITTSAKEGESFQETMQRLGITEPDDIDAFKKANSKSARRKYFLAGAQDVIIPASIASKLDYANMMVNADEQADAYKRRISGS